MHRITVFLFAVLTILFVRVASEGNIKTCSISAKTDGQFPPNFNFGTASAAFQIEGSWNADGKSPSTADELVHNSPNSIDGRTNADDTAESYTRFDQDLQALKMLKVKSYRFSIAWTRILPSGDISSLNSKGLEYYNMVINKLIENNIEPIVTMVHLDMPAEFTKLGSLTNDYIIEKFVDYAMVLFKYYGDRVKTWITFNQPLQQCTYGYGIAKLGPQIHSPGIGEYLCISNTLKAHAAAYRAYRKHFYDQQQGKISIALLSKYFYSETDNEADVQRGLTYYLDSFAKPIFSEEGGYPDVIVDDVARNSLNEGRVSSRLPKLSKYWIDQIRGSADYFALNYYSSVLINCTDSDVGQHPSFERDFGCSKENDPSWVQSVGEKNCVPDGLEKMLKHIREKYNNPEVLITENGWTDAGGLQDDVAIQYTKSHFQAALNAMKDGSNVSGFLVWSLMDDFEWFYGYTSKSGIFQTNFTSPTKERTPKKIAGFYRELIETNKIPNDY